MKNFLKQYWPSLVSAASALAGYLTPSVQAYAAANPGKSALVLGVWMIVLHHLTPPNTNPASKF
jgi:hypothetical protein